MLMEEGKKDVVVISLVGQPYHVTLKKMSKGYQWEISYHGKGELEVLHVIENLDSELRRRYGAGESE